MFANGKNDTAIGWSQAHEFWKALQETRRPHVFRWGQAGHGQRALLPGDDPGERELGVDVRLDQTLPAFTRCCLDYNPGDGDPLKSGARRTEQSAPDLGARRARSGRGPGGPLGAADEPEQKAPKERARWT